MRQADDVSDVDNMDDDHLAGVQPTAGKVTCLDPQAASQELARLLASEGAIVTSQSPGALTGYVVTVTPPSSNVGCLLLILGIVPAVIYWVLGKKSTQEPFSITLHEQDDGGTLMHGNGQGRGLAAIVWAADQLPR